MEFIYKIITIIIILIVLIYFFKKYEGFNTKNYDNSNLGNFSYLFNLETNMYLTLINDSISFTKNIFNATEFILIKYNDVYIIAKVETKNPLFYKYVQLDENQIATNTCKEFKINYVESVPDDNSYNGLLLYCPEKNNIYIAGGSPGYLLINSENGFLFSQTAFSKFINPFVYEQSVNIN